MLFNRIRPGKDLINNKYALETFTLLNKGSKKYERFKHVEKINSTITFEMTIHTKMDIVIIDVLDEDYLQPFDYQENMKQAYDANKEPESIDLLIDGFVKSTLTSFQNEGVISGYDPRGYLYTFFVDGVGYDCIKDKEDAVKKLLIDMAPEELKIMCNSLGVKINEPFKANDGKEYVINEDAIIFESKDKTEVIRDVWKKSSSELFENSGRLYHKILNKELVPIWKPKLNDYYWTVDFLSDSNVKQLKWSDSEKDIKLYNNNLAFKSKPEAIKKSDKMLESLLKK